MKILVSVLCIRSSWKYRQWIGEILLMKTSPNSTLFGLILIIHDVQYCLHKWSIRHPHYFFCTCRGEWEGLIMRERAPWFMACRCRVPSLSFLVPLREPRRRIKASRIVHRIRKLELAGPEPASLLETVRTVLGIRNSEAIRIMYN